MSDWPVQVAPHELVVISTNSLLGVPINAMSPGTSWGGAVWPAANRALFLPFPVYRPTTFYQLACYNAGTLNGNVDMGICDEAGNRLVSIGTTAQAGTSVWQYFNITDTTLSPGWYYLALASSSATAQFNRYSVNSSVALPGALGFVQMASAFALPSTATYARASSAYVPMMMALGRATA